MFENLSNDEKKLIIQEALPTYELELYRLLLELYIVPENFKLSDLSTLAIGEEEVDKKRKVEHATRLCDLISLMNSSLASTEI